MNLRDIYFKMRPVGIGRDCFEQLGRQLGLKVGKQRNWTKTTDSSGVKRFENYLKGLVVDRTDQVWQSDITYYQIAGRFYYLTFIQDAFSKVIVGHSVSKNLTTEQTTLPALKMALKKRQVQDESGLILHSDGGGQYYCTDFLEVTKPLHIINSMCKDARDNGMAERLNGIIKNNYLKPNRIKSFIELEKKVDRSVYLYNQEKPHRSLQRQTPNEFEKKLRCQHGQNNVS